MPIIVNLDVMLAKRKMSVTELSEKVGITMSNISILKNGKAKAIRFSTLEKICEVLDCQPGDILEYSKEERWNGKNYERYRWIINGPYPFGHFGGGPFQLFMYLGLFIVGIILIVISLVLKARWQYKMIGALTKKDVDLFERSSFNFTLAIYDTDTNTLYYFELDT